jgi:hypothetical protein
MKTSNFKTLFIVTALLAFTFNTNVKAQQNNGRGIGGNNGASIEHSANVNNNGNNGHAGEGNQGNGVGNMPYGNQGSNNNPNGRTGSRQTDSIPLDGGLSILLAAAAFFGIKKLRGSKKM